VRCISSLPHVDPWVCPVGATADGLVEFFHRPGGDATTPPVEFQANSLPQGWHRGQLPLVTPGASLHQPAGVPAQAHDVPIPQHPPEAPSHGSRRSRLGCQDAPRTPGGGADRQRTRRVEGGRQRPPDVVDRASGRDIRGSHLQPQDGSRVVGARRELQVANYPSTVGARAGGGSKFYLPLVNEKREGAERARGGASQYLRRGAAGPIGARALVSVRFFLKRMQRVWQLPAFSLTRMYCATPY